MLAKLALSAGIAAAAALSTAAPVAAQPQPTGTYTWDECTAQVKRHEASGQPGKWRCYPHPQGEGRWFWLMTQ